MGQTDREEARFDEPALAGLVELASLDPQGAPVEALVELFARNAREHVAAMRAAPAPSDRWTHAAHSLKSSAGMFGAVALARACAEAEILDRRDEGGMAIDAERALARVEECLAYTLDVLAERFPRAALGVTGR